MNVKNKSPLYSKESELRILYKPGLQTKNYSESQNSVFPKKNQDLGLTP